jgi:hypothetical protein
MKTIKINDRVLQYEVFCYSHGYSDSYYTEFYEGTEIIRKKKYLLFGPIVEEEIPKNVFTIFEDANNESLTKGWWRDRILHELELLTRREELERGELC